MHTIPDIIGLIGVFVLLLAYFLLQSGKLSTIGIGFSIYNLIGSALVLFSLLFKWNLSAAIIEIAWIIISTYGIGRILFKRKKNIL